MRRGFGSTFAAPSGARRIELDDDEEVDTEQPVDQTSKSARQGRFAVQRPTRNDPNPFDFASLRAAVVPAVNPQELWLVEYLTALSNESAENYGAPLQELPGFIERVDEYAVRLQESAMSFSRAGLALSQVSTQRYAVVVHNRHELAEYLMNFRASYVFTSAMIDLVCLIVEAASNVGLVQCVQEAIRSLFQTMSLHRARLLPLVAAIPNEEGPVFLMSNGGEKFAATQRADGPLSELGSREYWLGREQQLVLRHLMEPLVFADFAELTDEQSFMVVCMLNVVHIDASVMYGDRERHVQAQIDALRHHESLAGGRRARGRRAGGRCGLDGSFT